MSISINFFTPIPWSSWVDFCFSRYQTKIEDCSNRFILKGMEFSFFEQFHGIVLLRIANFDSSLTDVVKEILAITEKFPGKVNASEQIHNMLNDLKYRNAVALGEKSKKLASGVPRLRSVKLDKNNLIENDLENLMPGLNFDDVYLVMGEVSNIRHYIILNSKTGTILPGMFHLSRFEEVIDDDL